MSFSPQVLKKHEDFFESVDVLQLKDKRISFIGNIFYKYMDINPLWVKGEPIDSKNLLELLKNKDNEYDYILKSINILQLRENNLDFICGEFYTNIPHPYGGQDICISLEDVLEFLKDRDATIAKKFRITKDHYYRWLEFIQNPQCSAMTRKKTQCKNPCWGFEEELDTPDKFNPNEDYFCTTHKEHTEKLRIYNNRFAP